jgi:beige protein homolog 1
MLQEAGTTNSTLSGSFVCVSTICSDSQPALTAALGIVKRLLDALKGESFSADVFPDFLEAFSAVFRCSISPETLRSLALFVTFALQDSRAFPHRSSKVTLISRQAQKDLNGQGAVYTGRERSSSRPSPFNAPISPSAEVSRFEIGVQMLEVFTEVLCEPGTDIVYKFATTVTNKVSNDASSAENRLTQPKWLLFLLAERDPRIVVLATKVLARLLIVHGPSYIKDFSARSGGFIIMKQRLKTWWSVPALWTTLFAILFGIDVAKIDYSEDFNQFTLAEIFHSTSGRMAYPDVLPVLTAMLENGLRSIVQDGKFPSESGDTTSTKPSGGNEFAYPDVGWHSDSLNVQGESLSNTPATSILTKQSRKRFLSARGHQQCGDFKYGDSVSWRPPPEVVSIPRILRHISFCARALICAVSRYCHL